MRTVAGFLIALVVAGCSPAHAPKARTAGKVMSLTGVGGLIVTAFAAGYTGDATRNIVAGFSMLSAVGVGTYAVGDLSQPHAGHEETLVERHHRWARILTDRAYGYARDGRCPRVKHIETRVRVYDREFHDFVFMKDSEIVKCLTTPASAAPGEPESVIQEPGAPVDSP